jgi:phosphatidylglycerol lysyltransferase
VSGGLRAARAWTRALYDFEGVHAFKAKLRPHGWEPIHLAHLEGTSANVALVDALLAFARGSFARFGLETLMHGPAIVVRALGALLVPWTWMLALAPARWFPGAPVHWGWVAFDVGLACALFVLAARWRAGLARALATAITLDAAVTWAQALVFDAPRVRHLLDAVVLVAACLAPAAAAVILWGAIGHRAWMREDPPRLAAS